MADYEATPPHDLDAERAALGGALLSGDALAAVLELVRPADFYRPAHQVIFETVIELYGRGDPADQVTVVAELVKNGTINRVGGGPYLHELAAKVPTAANASYYARIVADKAKLRRLAEASTQISQMAYTANGEDADGVLDRAQSLIFAIAERRNADDYVPIAEVMPGALDEIEAIGKRGGEMIGCPTGFADLDELTQGLHPGQLIIVAARPAMGKSTLALDFARAASIRHGRASVMFSLEMGRNEIAMRLLSAEGRVGLHSIRSGHIDDADWQRLAGRIDAITEAPLFIDDSPNLTITEIRSKCRRLKQQNNLRLVVVDYLQLMSSGGRTESRQVEVSEFSRRLKLLAKELEVPVVALSQLNRGPEQRVDKKPLMSDLRESGSLEQDADMVILVHREDAYDKESPRAGEADLIVAKHRNGPTATVTVAFQGHYSRFADMAY